MDSPNTTTSKQAVITRPPVVVMLGHVDHGKTTLLDYIRKTNVVAREAGGITQSIGAYEIEHNGKKITFIDTPGHEAFSKIRSRGADVADIAVLVVAADDGIKPQTAESIRILKESKTPYIVAINKTDLSGANVEKIKTDLLEHDVLLEGFGGDVSWQAVSAKTGDGVGDLLDHILLTAEVEGIAGSALADEGRGYVIESRMDRNRGIEGMIILKDGVLRIGDMIVAGRTTGKIKILENFLGERVSELHPSSPALIIGFDELPDIGEEFVAGANVNEGKKQEKKAAQPSSEREITPVDKDCVVVKFIVKADTAGSLEAFSGVIRELGSDKVRPEIIGESVGDVSDGDVRAANDTGAYIVGLHSRISKSAETLAHAQGVETITSKIIYELITAIEEKLQAAADPTPTGELEVLALFSENGNKQVVGGKVISGVIALNAIVEIWHDDVKIGSGKITNLQCDKKDAKTVEMGRQCGMLLQVSGDVHVKEKDMLRIAGVRN